MSAMAMFRQLLTHPILFARDLEWKKSRAGKPRLRLPARLLVCSAWTPYLQGGMLKGQLVAQSWRCSSSWTFILGYREVGTRATFTLRYQQLQELHTTSASRPIQLLAIKPEYAIWG
jgi:hypothetical protein